VERFNYFYPKKFQRLCGRSGMIDNVKEGFLVKFQVLFFLFFNLFYTIMKFRDRDLVHVQWPIPNGFGALFLKKIYGIPYVNTIHGEEVYLSKRYHTLSLLRCLVDNSFKSVTNSNATLKACLEAGFKEEKFEVIPFGVDTDHFKPFKFRRKSEDSFQILAVGYLIERKGFEYLIRGMKDVLIHHKNVKLKIVGSGPLEAKLYSLINDLDLDGIVEILRNVSDNDLLKLYNNSDLFVLPSIVDSQGNTEGLGVVLLEAMACGVPVIGTDVGGISDIIKNNKNGLLVPEKNPKKLAYAINSVISNNCFRRNIALNGLNYVRKNYGWEIVSKKYIKIYKKFY